jgi:hypothetical protein
VWCELAHGHALCRCAPMTLDPVGDSRRLREQAATELERCAELPQRLAQTRTAIQRAREAPSATYSASTLRRTPGRQAIRLTAWAAEVAAVEQAALDSLQQLKEQYAELMRQEDAERLEGWERRMKALSDAITDIHGTPLREAARRRSPD